MVPILVKSDDVRRGRKAKVRHRCQWVNKLRQSSIRKEHVRFKYFVGISAKRERKKEKCCSEESGFFNFIVFICKFYKGQANRYHNASLNNFYIIKGCTHTHTHTKDKEGKKK